MLNRMHRAEARIPTAVIIVCLASLVLLVFPTRARAVELPPDQADWVCVTTPSLAAAFAPLAEHRERQGLSTRIVTVTDLYSWFPMQPGHTARLRALAEAAHAEWGARYLLIGGDQGDLPAPYCRIESSLWLWTAPVDLYFGCLDDDWDADGDGWVGELEDLPDLEPELAVGRIPAPDAAAAAAVVDKILAYEGRAAAGRDRVLLAATALTEVWVPGNPPLPLPGNDHVAAVLEILDGSLRDFAPTAMLHIDDQPPGGEELTPEALTAALTDGGYDLAMFFGQGEADLWSCGNYTTLGIPDLAPLAEGRPFILDALAIGSCCLIEPSMGVEMLLLPGGGAAAVRGYATGCSIFPLIQMDRAFWTVVAGDEHPRLGDAHVAGIAAAATAADVPPVTLQQLATLMLLGDPALLHHLPAESGVPAATAWVRDLLVAPNPFNPGTGVSFELTADALARVEIFDVRGRRVALLHDGPLAAGPHALTWRPDASLSDGVFFARVRTGAGTQTVKLLRLD